MAPSWYEPCFIHPLQEILVRHVRSIHLGRRNFHYLMAGLVLDDHWDEHVLEFGAINVTGGYGRGRILGCWGAIQKH